MLNDNMGVVLSIQKGRSSSYGLLRLIQRISSHCLASGVRLHVRWVPSELNVADAPSRQWEPKKPWKRPGVLMPGSASEAEDRGVQQESSAGIQPEDEHSSRGRLEKEEQKRKVTIPSEGKARPGCSAGASKLVESQREEETEGETETEQVHPEAESFKGRDEHLGDEQRQGASEEGLLEEARFVLRVRKPTSDRHPPGGGPRCGSLRLCRSFVSEWRRSRCRMEAKSRSRVCEARGNEEDGPVLAAVSASFERMEEDGAGADPATYAGVHQELYLWPNDVCWTEANGPLQRADILDLCTAWRGHADHMIWMWSHGTTSSTSMWWC